MEKEVRASQMTAVHQRNLKQSDLQAQGLIFLALGTEQLQRGARGLISDV